jgi:site-specific DNA recombinase
MLESAHRGEFDVILSYSNSRLTRRLREYLDLIDLYEKTGVLICTCVSGDDDLSTADGRMVAKIKASVDEAEADKISERVNRRIADKAAAGNG